MKRLSLLLVVSFIVSVLISGCAKKNYYDPDTSTQAEETKKVEIKAITLEQQKLSMDIGDAALMEPTISPEEALNKPVKWSSSNNEIVTVNKQGIVFAKKSGKSTITVSDDTGNIKADCEITVKSARKAIIKDNVPTQSFGGEYYKITVAFENCEYPLIKIIADCGGGSVKTQTETIKLGTKEEQFQFTSEATISFGISSSKQVSHLRILCFDNGELFDCKEYNVTRLIKQELPSENSNIQDSVKKNTN